MAALLDTSRDRGRSVTDAICGALRRFGQTKPAGWRLQVRCVTEPVCLQVRSLTEPVDTEPVVQVLLNNRTCILQVLLTEPVSRQRCELYLIGLSIFLG